MSRGRNAFWRTPTPEQREILDRILLADFPNRDAIAACIAEIRVQPDFARTSGWFDFRLPESIQLQPQDWPVTFYGTSTTGNTALVLLFPKDGRDFELEIAPYDREPLGKLDPTTLTVAITEPLPPPPTH